MLLIIKVNAADCFPRYECGVWGECKDGLQSRVCEDKTCGNRDIVERSFCEKEGCQPKIECDDWGPCFYTEKTDNLLKGKVSFGGYRNRVCRDVSGCVDSFIQEGSCEESYTLQLEELQECGGKFLEIVDPSSGRRIAKINLNSWKANKLDIAFTQGETGYCPSCYNAVKDKDEEGIDCGGNCRPCKKENRLFMISVVTLWALSALFSLLSVREIVLFRKKKTIFTEKNGKK